VSAGSGCTVNNVAVGSVACVLARLAASAAIVALLVLAVLCGSISGARPPAARARCRACGGTTARSPPSHTGSYPFAAVHRAGAHNFFCCATHSGPIIHTVSYAVTCGHPLTYGSDHLQRGRARGLGGRIASAGGDRPVLGGWIYDAFGSYGSLYLVAWGSE